MADESSRSDDLEGSKHKGWNKFRGKIFDKDNKLSKLKRHHGHSHDQGQDVDDFLRPSTGSSNSLTGPGGPKLDISAAKSHVSSAAGDSGYIDSTSARAEGNGGIPSYAPTREDMMSGKWRPIKATRAPGLQVGFLDGPADLIGEGGEESEDAPLVISQRHQNKHRGRPPAPPSYQEPRPFDHSDETPLPGKLHRAPTGMNEVQPSPYQSVPPHGAYTGHPTPAIPNMVPRKPSLPVQQQQPSVRPSDGAEEEEEPIRPLRRAPTGFEEARQHRQQISDPAPDLHLNSPESPPHQLSYEQQMQKLLTKAYPHTSTASGDHALTGAPPAKTSSTHQKGGRAHPPMPSLRTREGSSTRSPLREPRINEPSPSSELRSPVDSSNMRRMRAEEGLTHRNSVQGAHGIPGGDDAAAAALAKLSPGLDAPQPYSAQGRSSFDSVRSGSDRSRYSLSPDPSSVSRPPARHSANSLEEGQYLSPPSSSHGMAPRPLVPQRHSIESTHSPPPSFYEQPDASEMLLAYGGSDPTTSKGALPGSALTAPERQPHPSNISRRDDFAEDALSHFANAISGTGSIFRLATENSGPRMTLYEWVRCALWWFLKGREGIEETIRLSISRTPSADPQHRSRPVSIDSPSQYHLNLAKSYWILTDVIPRLIDHAQVDPRSVPSSQNPAAVEMACNELTEAFKTLAVSMRRHNLLPSPQEKFMQGLDNSIWSSIGSDKFPPDWQWVLSGKVFAPPKQTADVEPLFAIPLQDSRSQYCYGRVFLSATVSIGDDKPVMDPFECILSFTRAKTVAEAEIVLSTQANDLNVHVRAAGEHGVHWEHTKFDPEERSLRVKLPQKLRLRLFLSQRDYTYLRNVYENSQRISQTLLPRKNERLLQTVMLRSFHYRDSLHPEEFPSGPVGFCKASLFEQVTKSERNPRRIHAGFRFAVVNLEKTVRNVNVSFGKTAPLEYNISSSQPSFQFQLNEAGRRRSAHILFEDAGRRDLFRDLVSGTVLGKTECVTCRVPIVSLALSRATAATNLAPAVLKWKSLDMIDEDDPADPQRLSSSADASETLRVMMYSKTGSIVDRMNDAAVDLKIRLEPANPEQFQIYRNAERHDMTIAIGPDLSETNELRQVFDVVASGPHMSAYTFTNLKDLHIFERAVTGFRVIYDGVVSSFSIPRRKPGSVVAKHLESTAARVQIVEREKVTQLIAFFHDYVLADSINFEIKRTDQFDRTDSKTLGFGVKMVDAKFSLPGSGKDDPIKDGAVRDVSAKYTAFDTDEYAAEHDDITISFKTEQGKQSLSFCVFLGQGTNHQIERDAFAEALPAPVSLGKKFTLRRRI